MGLVSEIVPEGSCRSRAEELALEISKMPSLCMLNDRKSLYDQEALNLPDALRFI